MRSARRATRPDNGASRQDKIVSLLRLYQGLKRVHDLLDKARAELESVRGKPVCVENCGLCCECRTPVVSLLEASYLVGHLPDLRRADLVTRCAFEWLEVEDARLTIRGLPRGTLLSGEDRVRLGADVALLAQSRCPFLADNRACLVYPHRPLWCRGYGVTLAPDHWCRRPIAAIETDEARAVIGRDTALGESVKGAIVAVWRAATGFGMAEYTNLGMLPALVAELLDPARHAKLLARGVVADAKLALGAGLPDVFGAARPEVIARPVGYVATPVAVNRAIGDAGVGEVS